MPVFAYAPTAGWDVQTIPCGPLWLRVCWVPVTPSPAAVRDGRVRWMTPAFTMRGMGLCACRLAFEYKCVTMTGFT